MSLIIDFHVHASLYYAWYPHLIEWMQPVLPTDAKTFIDGTLTPDGARKFFKEESGLDYCVALAEQSPITAGIMTNDATIELCRAIDFFIPFASINPHLVAEPVKELERCVLDLGFKGLKLLPPYQGFYPNERTVYSLYAKAEELGIPVMFHTGSSVFAGSRLKFGDPLFIDDVAVDFPDLVIVMSHSGRGFWYDAAFFLAGHHENVYMEVAGLPPQSLPKYFPDLEQNADKIIFGSDWPSIPHIKKNIETIRKLPISESAKQKILGDNAARILGLNTEVEQR
ncbi:MAG: amidohydrolase [Chloroflexi bacterium]|nr:amidohydrolase [Chloroflexota bacterium]